MRTAAPSTSLMSVPPPAGIIDLISRVREPVSVVKHAATGRIGLSPDIDRSTVSGNRDEAYSSIGLLPPLYPEWLGDRTFLETHCARFPYVVGEMATGIAGPPLVISAARHGLLSFFGAAGLDLQRIEDGIVEIGRALGADNLAWGSNLIHSPTQPELEHAVVDLYLRHDLRRVSASAFMRLSPAVVRFAASGLHIAQSGKIRRRRFLFAKVSRPEIAAQFLSPPPASMLDSLVASRLITTEEAQLAARLPVVEDITLEADSGGHTDNRPLISLLPVICTLRDRLSQQHGYSRPVRVGAAGGIGTPTAVAAAFGLGAAYVMTGSINQSALEASTSAAVKRMLSAAEVADVAMAPAADMFELGVKVQVLKRGTLFAARAARLYAIYATTPSLDAIPSAIAAQLERDIFRTSMAHIWEDCVRFWGNRDPTQIARAEQDPRHKMALVFRWYLGGGSRWAVAGDPERNVDYQIWCGPAMGAFNAWSEGSFLSDPANRTVAQIALNLMEGAAVATRAQQARSYGVAVAPAAFYFRPRPLS
jgi:trans-AT polyketide synthase, acyltransferase and oxidoreductase domains